jgi:hypothetical protein
MAAARVRDRSTARPSRQCPPFHPSPHRSRRKLISVPALGWASTLAGCRLRVRSASWRDRFGSPAPDPRSVSADSSRFTPQFACAVGRSEHPPAAINRSVFSTRLCYSVRQSPIWPHPNQAPPTSTVGVTWYRLSTAKAPGRSTSSQTSQRTTPGSRCERTTPRTSRTGGNRLLSLVDAYPSNTVRRGPAIEHRPSILARGDPPDGLPSR